MNILILTSWYPNEINTINGVFVREQARALIKEGVNVKVFFPYDKSIKKGEIKKCLDDNIITYRANTDYMKNSKISRVNSIFKSVKLLQRIVKENNIDLIHAHVCYPAGFVAAIYNKIFNIPFIITEHMSYIKSYSSKIYNHVLFKFAYSKAKKVICVSKFLKNELISLGFKFNGEIIGNIVQEREELNVNFHKEHNSYKIIFIGLMDKSEVKGLEYFIPALSEFITENIQYNIECLFIGDGEKRSKYESMCHKLNIKDKCKFCGKISKDNIFTYIEKCDFLVLPSKKETFGSVLIEAMSCGKPVLATKCGGPEEVVIKEVGVLVKSESKDALKAGLKKIIENYNDYKPYYIKKYIDDNFGYHSICTKLIEIYSKILK